MIRYGASAQDMQPIPAHELFMQRLKLLIIMTKACLKGNPLGDFRKKAVLHAARFIFAMARSHTHQLGSSASPDTGTASFRGLKTHGDYLFLQQAQLLAVMATALAKGIAPGRYRKKAMQNSINFICSYLSKSPIPANDKILKVA